MENNEQVHPHPETSLVDGGQRFAVCLKRIRLELKNKQVWLSEAIGCSDAAVSLWESGARIPTAGSMSRILAVLAREGATTSELLELRRFWVREGALRRTSRRG
jgi:DNA-binding transcriptional regulator YiaG